MKNKTSKHLAASYAFTPIAVGSFGASGSEGLLFLSYSGYHLKLFIYKPRAFSFSVLGISAAV